MPETKYTLTIENTVICPHWELSLGDTTVAMGWAPEENARRHAQMLADTHSGVEGTEVIVCKMVTEMVDDAQITQQMESLNG